MINIAVLGYGTVGSGVVELLDKNKDIVKANAGDEINVKYILDIKDFENDKYKDKLIKNFDIIINDKDIKIAAEVIGGATVAYEYTKRLLEAGINVVTSNKELVASHGMELLEIAKKRRNRFTNIRKIKRGIMEFDEEKANNKEYVLEMVKKQGSLLDYASDELKNDKEVVLAAIQQDGNALEFAGKKLKDDKEVVLESIKKVGWTACYVSSRLSDDKEVMLDAVKIDGQELYYASKQLRDDYDVVLTAVKNKGLILKYASKRLRANREIAEAAVANDKRAIEYISDENLKAELSKEEEN